MRKGRKVAKHCAFPMICGSGGSKSRLAKAAGADPPPCIVSLHQPASDQRPPKVRAASADPPEPLLRGSPYGILCGPEVVRGALFDERWMSGMGTGVRQWTLVDTLMLHVTFQRTRTTRNARTTRTTRTAKTTRTTREKREKRKKREKRRKRRKKREERSEGVKIENTREKH